jgi:hypothetical protein
MATAEALTEALDSNSTQHTSMNSKDLSKYNDHLHLSGLKALLYTCSYICIFAPVPQLLGAQGRDWLH